MNKKYIIVLSSLAIFFNGCSLYRAIGIKKNNSKIVKKQKIKQSSIIRQEINNKEEINHKNVTKDDTKKKISKKVKNKRVKTSKNIKKRRVAKNKTNKLKPEPFSIKSNQKDPELLGPQTTLKNNPISKVESATSNKM